MVSILRAATWNFGYGSAGSPSRGCKPKVQKALEYLQKNNVDIVLAQEIFDPYELRSIYPNQIYSDIPIYNPQGQGIWGAIEFSADTRNNNKRPKWGTAILAAKNINLNKIELKYNTSYPGTITIAQIAETDIAVISMYGKNIYDYEKVTAYSYLANLHRCLSDMAPLLDGYSSAQRFIIAGDWNAGPQWDNRKSRKNFNFFERLATFGLKDCLGHFPDGEYEMTFKHNRNRQIDWMFSSPQLNIREAHVERSFEIEDVSDHYPIITEFDIEKK